MLLPTVYEIQNWCSKLRRDFQKRLCLLYSTFMILWASIGLIAAATRFGAARAVPAPKMLTVSRVKVLFFFYFFPIAIDEPPFDFITDVGRFLFLNHAELHARFISHHSCFFTTIPFLFFTHAARKQCHRGHWINFNFLLFAANKNILIRTSVLINN